MNFDNAKDKNTTIWGIGILLAAAGTALVAQFDGDTTTNIQWAAIATAALAAVKLIFGSKDPA